MAVQERIIWSGFEELHVGLSLISMMCVSCANLQYDCKSDKVTFGNRRIGLPGQYKSRETVETCPMTKQQHSFN